MSPYQPGLSPSNTSHLCSHNKSQWYILPLLTFITAFWDACLWIPPLFQASVKLFLPIRHRLGGSYRTLVESIIILLYEPRTELLSRATRQESDSSPLSPRVFSVHCLGSNMLSVGQCTQHFPCSGTEKKDMVIVS